MPDISLPSAFKVEQYGESSYPSALPWDVIKAVPFQKTDLVNNQIVSELSKSYLERTKSDISLKKYIEETNDLKVKLSETKVSLNESKRRAEMAVEDKKEAQEKLDTKVTAKEGLPVDDLQNLKDGYLREGLLILGDLVTKRFG
ncbi:MAG: carboxy terminal-processing peptidase [Flammeovirgaceae bacterium]|nr:carboxy terminal-processing peptidase [Flammeovirgaceae bacterium]